MASGGRMVGAVCPTTVSGKYPAHVIVGVTCPTSSTRIRAVPPPGSYPAAVTVTVTSQTPSAIKLIAPVRLLLTRQTDAVLVEYAADHCTAGGSATRSCAAVSDSPTRPCPGG